MKNITDRLNELMAFYAINKSVLAERLRISPSAVTGFLQNKSVPSMATLQELLQSFPDISPDWLITGSGSMLRSLPDHFINLPVAGKIAAGTPIQISNLDPLNHVTLDVTKHGPPDELLCFQVDGDSMAPLITHQDIVVCSRRFDLHSVEKKIAAIQINGENTLKMIILNHLSRQLILMPLNCRSIDPMIYDPESPDNITILGVLILQIRQH